LRAFVLVATTNDIKYADFRPGRYDFKILRPYWISEIG
jgi:hypothetical protein